MSADKYSILVVDDEEVMRTLLRKQLQKWGYDVTCVPDGDQAVEAYRTKRFDLILTDLKMPGRDGIGVVETVKTGDPQALVIVMSAFGTIESAVEAMKKGAENFVTKPLNMDGLKLVLSRTLEKRAIAREAEELRACVESRFSSGDLIGSSPAMRNVYQLMDKVAETTASVLIVGETGTGKELVARTIHVKSKRTQRRFVPVNCAAIPEALQESEFFGHEKGSFTGAYEQKIGLIEQADGGTLFLDEITSAGLSLQAKLLRVLETRQFTRVGGSDLIEIDFRLICASNKDVKSEVEEGRFRDDLRYRINTVTLELPPLRDRRDDIPLLAEHFLQKYATRLDKPVIPWSEEALLKLMRYPWPGNVRELEHAVEHAVIVDSDRLLTPDDLPEFLLKETVYASSAPQDLKETRLVSEREYLIQLLTEARGNVTEVARRAGLARSYLHEKLKRLGIVPDIYRQ